MTNIDGVLRPAASSRSAGSQPSCTAKTVISRMPARNAGTATPTCESAERTSPDGWRCRTAISVPSGTAMSERDDHADAATSHRVTCSRSATCGPIGARTRRTLPRSTVQQPAEPVERTAPRSGRSRPNSLRAAAATACVGRVDAQRNPGRVAGQHAP